MPNYDKYIKEIESKKDLGSYNSNYQKSLENSSRIIMKSDISTMLLYMIEYGAGICLAPLRFKEEGAVCLDNIPCDMTFTVYLSAHRSVKDAPKVRAVIDYCKEVIGKMSAE